MSFYINSDCEEDDDIMSIDTVEGEYHESDDELAAFDHYELRPRPLSKRNKKIIICKYHSAKNLIALHQHILHMTMTTMTEAEDIYETASEHYSAKMVVGQSSTHKKYQRLLYLQQKAHRIGSLKKKQQRCKGDRKRTIERQFSKQLDAEAMIQGQELNWAKGGYEDNEKRRV